jgi:hypothetical protein
VAINLILHTQLMPLTQKEREEHLKLWGHLPPQLHAELVGVKELPENAVENHAKVLKTDPVHFAAAKAYHQWGIGKEMEVEEYSAAVKQVLAERHGY